MIRFVDLETGNTFDGSYPYVFWFKGEQSTNIIYSQPICFISNNQIEKINIDINDVFYLIDTSKLTDKTIESIYDFNYYNLNDLKTTSLESYGNPHHNYFIHIIYIVASASNNGEYRCNITIGGNSYAIGADFYAEDETLYINLSNNGIEIPPMIQKAIYDVNIHEEKLDNITINRKWKELLSNYWDMLANKGSYKSLFNSLKWFEYGDLVKLYEVWKNDDTGKYFIKDIQQTLENKFIEVFDEFQKTTYLALYHTMDQPIVEDDKILLDDEKNPELQKISTKWSIQDLALKLCMLGNFYETYFMPIHLNLIHTTIEDVVYTNTFKTRSSGILNRQDYICYCDDIKCNVKDGSIYTLGHVECYVGPKTLFASNYNDGVDIIGVQREQVADKFKFSNNNSTSQDLVNYLSQMYKNIGAIVDFDLQIPLYPEDKIKRETIVFKTYIKTDNGWDWKYKTLTEHQILDKNIKFSLLCPIEGEYEVKLQFDSIAGKTYTKKIRFSVIDINGIDINIYKVIHKKNITDGVLGTLHQINDYIFARRCLPIYTKYPVQYIPANKYNIDKINWGGVCLNHLLILNYNAYDENNKNKLTSVQKQSLSEHYFELYRGVVVGENEKKYGIYVSKVFGFSPKDDQNMLEVYNSLNQNNYIYREDYIFVPEFHEIEPLIKPNQNLEISNYIVTDEDTLCVLPGLSYGKYIAEYDWEFINTSRPDLQPIKLSHIKEPFVANIEESPLPKGYYTVVFKYRLTNEEKINTITLDSAFIKV